MGPVLSGAISVRAGTIALATVGLFLLVIFLYRERDGHDTSAIGDSADSAIAAPDDIEQEGADAEAERQESFTSDQVDDLVGLPLANALDWARLHGLEVIVVDEDDGAVKLDYNPQRLTVVVNSESTVVSASIS
jgi:hypothetical protein